MKKPYEFFLNGMNRSRTYGHKVVVVVLSAQGWPQPMGAKELSPFQVESLLICK